MCELKSPGHPRRTFRLEHPLRNHQQTHKAVVRRLDSISTEVRKPTSINLIAEPVLPRRNNNRRRPPSIRRGTHPHVRLPATEVSRNSYAHRFRSKESKLHAAVCQYRGHKPRCETCIENHVPKPKAYFIFPARYLCTRLSTLKNPDVAILRPVTTVPSLPLKFPPTVSLLSNPPESAHDMRRPKAQSSYPFPATSHAATILAFATLTITLAGCAFPSAKSTSAPTSLSHDLIPTRLTRGNLAPSTNLDESSLSLRGARNEWLDAFLKLTPRQGKSYLRLTPPTSASASLPDVKLYRVLSLPFDTRSVASVRAAGPGAPDTRLPTVLIPLESAGEDFLIPENTTLLYLELRAPLTADAATYTGSLALASDRSALASAPTLPLTVAIDDLALSDAASVSLYGEVPYADLERLFPKQFDTAAGGIEPRFLSRDNPRHLIAIERMDQIVRLAHDHRLDVGFTRLEPIVKLSPREGTRIDWTDYDNLVFPWLTGEIDPSKEGLTAFPLPVPAVVTAGGLSPADYLAIALGHFDDRRLLPRMLLPAELPESALANLPPELTQKIRRPGPPQSLSTQSLEGLRHVAWQAFAEDRNAARAGIVSPATSNPNDPGEASRAVWFYPAEWFGQPAAGVLPSVELKWARRAQQDRELFELAKRRRATDLTQTIAREATRSGQSKPILAADLTAPIADPALWEKGLDLVRSAAALRAPDAKPLTDDIKSVEDAAVAQWAHAAHAPTILPIATRYYRQGDQLRVDTTFAIDAPPTAGRVETAITQLPDGWSNESWKTESTESSSETHTLTATLDPTAFRYPPTRAFDAQGRRLGSPGSLILESVTRNDGVRAERETSLPAFYVLASPTPPTLDGSLTDWSDEELIHAGPLVQMLDRRSVQTSETLPDASETKIYARWDNQNLYLALRIEAAAPPPPGPSTNFTPESHGRATGQDLIRIQLAPISSPTETPAPLRLLLKPNSLSTESAPPTPNAPQPQYAATLTAGVWRAELTIPITLLAQNALTPNTPLALTLTRHSPTTGESSSLAGPIDTDTQPAPALLLLIDHPPKPKSP